MSGSSTSISAADAPKVTRLSRRRCVAAPVGWPVVRVSAITAPLSIAAGEASSVARRTSSGPRRTVAVGAARASVTIAAANSGRVSQAHSADGVSAAAAASSAAMANDASPAKEPRGAPNAPMGRW